MSFTLRLFYPDVRSNNLETECAALVVVGRIKKTPRNVHLAELESRSRRHYTTYILIGNGEFNCESKDKWNGRTRENASQPVCSLMIKFVLCGFK
jgi:hypothetical protein